MRASPPLWVMHGAGDLPPDRRKVSGGKMSERMKEALVALLAIIALALFVATGGDGRDFADHAEWMAHAKDQGTVVLW